MAQEVKVVCLKLYFTAGAIKANERGKSCIVKNKVNWHQGHSKNCSMS